MDEPCKGLISYIEVEHWLIRARINGQEALAFHLAMARDALLMEEFGSILSLKPRAIERLVQEEMILYDPGRLIGEGDIQ